MRFAGAAQARSAGRHSGRPAPPPGSLLWGPAAAACLRSLLLLVMQVEAILGNLELAAEHALAQLVLSASGRPYLMIVRAYVRRDKSPPCRPILSETSLSLINLAATCHRRRGTPSHHPVTSHPATRSPMDSGQPLAQLQGAAEGVLCFSPEQDPASAEAVLALLSEASHAVHVGLLSLLERPVARRRKQSALTDGFEQLQHPRRRSGPRHGRAGGPAGGRAARALTGQPPLAQPSLTASVSPVLHGPPSPPAGALM